MVYLQVDTDLSVDENVQYLRYKLTLLKKLSQSTKPSKVKERADYLPLSVRTRESRVIFRSQLKMQKNLHRVKYLSIHEK